MKPGRVVKIRLNPQLCMGCVDVVNKVGAYKDGISFAQCIVLALESTIASFKANGLIPDRDGFEYLEMMRPFHDQPHIDRARKLQLAKEIDKGIMPVRPIAPNPEMARKRNRFEALAFQSNNSAENMSNEEKDELIALTQELYPV